MNKNINKKYLNFGCGDRYHTDWVNIDFHSNHNEVRAVNLLDGFPFDDNSFDAVYSSHVLEHFDKQQGKILLEEAYRVLRPGGILRIVVPDLQSSCAEYLRILDLSDSDPYKQKYYDWMIIEMLDQMVRTKPSGEMGNFVSEVMSSDDQKLQKYIGARRQNTPWREAQLDTVKNRIFKLTRQKILNKFVYLYLKSVACLIPKNIRSMVYVETSIGERHRWMYDYYGLGRLFESLGFLEVKRCTCDQSRIDSFNEYGLDCNADGTSYKNNSVYIEGVK